MTTIAELPRRTNPGLVGPTILVGLGIVLLLNNLGLLAWGVWGTLFRLWPVLLIALGLDLMVGRRSFAITALIALTMLVVLGAAIWYDGAWARRGILLPTNTIQQSLSGATRGDVTLQLGVGELRLSAMETPNGLISGNVYSGRGMGVRQLFDVRDDTAFMTLQQEAGNRVGSWNVNAADERWDLQLNPTVPLRLSLDTGAGVTRADLRELTITDLTVNSGVGQIDLTLPESGRLSGTINGGIGETIVTIPPDVGARLTIQRGLGDVRTPPGFTRNGDIYQSPGYAEASDRVDLRISGGIGAIEVRMGR
jgi:hypothetical protein